MKKAAWIGAVLSLVLLLGSCTTDNQNPTDTTNNTEVVTNVTSSTEAETQPETTIETESVGKTETVVDTEGAGKTETTIETEGAGNVGGTETTTEGTSAPETTTESTNATTTETTVETTAETVAGTTAETTVETTGTPETTTETETTSENDTETESETEVLQYTRVDGTGTVDSTGGYILFGSWPQSEVTGTGFVAALNELAGALPTSENSGAWTSYDYYDASSNTTDFMWYQDVVRGENTYRGVYFNSYRPKTTTHLGSESTSQQDEHGYTTKTVYWFKWEPLKWRILDEQNGNALLLCEMLIDAQAYQTCFNKSTGYLTDAAGEYVLDDNGNKISANNYEHSTIRAWLADTFYATAFTDLQKDIIQLTTVDNSAASTTDSTGALSTADDYVCGDTQDYVFLLSENEVTREEYGFAPYNSNEPARLKRTTAYANCQGAQTHAGLYATTGWWWLRSPHYQSMGEYVCEVYNDGYTSGSNVVNYTIYGICPALWIKL